MTHPCLEERPLSPHVREVLRRAVDEVRKRLAFDAALCQRWLRGLGVAPSFHPCPACGRPVEQGRFVAYLFCSTECALVAGVRDE